MGDEPNPNPTPEPTPTPKTQEEQANALFPSKTAPDKPVDKGPELAPVFIPDPAKTADENAAAKIEFDKANPPKEPAKPDEVPVLDKAAVKMPEGFEVDDPTLDKFLGIMNDKELTPAARAQQLIDLQAAFVKEASEKGSQLFVQQQEAWQTEVRNDPEIGGAKLDENLGSISKLIDNFGTPKLREVFDVTGAGNNPEMVKFLVKIGQAVGEGKLLPAGAPTGGPKTQAQKMFPSMKE